MLSTTQVEDGWFDQDGVLRPTGYDRLTPRLDNTYKVHDKIGLGYNLTFSNSRNISYGSISVMWVMNSTTHLPAHHTSKWP